VSFRPLVFVSGLTLGDYLLWKLSLSTHHDTLALVSGLTLPPLGAACLWLVALAVMRLVARHTRLPARRTERRRIVRVLRARTRRSPSATRRAGSAMTGEHGPAQQTTSSASSSGKLAA
jgi:hypothetical protein